MAEATNNKQGMDNKAFNFYQQAADVLTQIMNNEITEQIDLEQIRAVSHSVMITADRKLEQMHQQNTDRGIER